MGNAVVHRGYTNDTFIIPNEILTDGRVPIKARGIMLIIYSLANDGDTVFRVKDVKKYCRETDRTIERALHSLEVGGYLERTPESRNEKLLRNVAYEIRDKTIYEVWKKEELKDAEKVSTRSN